MRLNFKLNDFNKWQGENFSCHDYIYHTLKIGNVSSDIFFAFLELFWPRFLIYNNYIFLEGQFSQKYLNDLEKGKDDKVEFWMNLLTIDSYFEDDDEEWEERSEALAKALVETWKAKLSIDFPDIKFQVTYLEDKETGDYGLTFYQKKD